MNVKVVLKLKLIISWVRLFFLVWNHWNFIWILRAGGQGLGWCYLCFQNNYATTKINHHNFNEWKDATAPISLWLSVTPPLALSGFYWISPSLSLGLSGFSFQTLLLCPSDDVFWGESFCLHTLGRNEIEIKSPNIVSIYKTIIQPWLDII